ncbi:O-succinylhomoserine sulfhydrylase [Plasticicumulans sp.]|uniref:O-succinylhomoserine sulfhydrylase n=1 Tax=Plasticicumulans sp. TaxID=2307179 RepID=UPI002BA8BCA3|nr:O-succinylhomoserine sulfhydrylase [Plasticicumulans sp.]HNM42406.1 O-succinylhomoserine sulfhydrylase [Plasticicumulans sp.]
MTADLIPELPDAADDAALAFASLAVRAGQSRSAEGEHSEAIYPTSSYVFDSAAQAAARFAGEEPGNIYSRFTNPTVRMFEQRLAALEGGEACVATSSGMAAVLTACMGLLKQGDHVVCSRDVFGNTTALLNNFLARFGVATTYVPLSDTAAWRAALRPETKVLYLETPSNPLMELADIRELADIAHDHGALLVVDNCFCTPALQRPLALGADVVVHSATKYIDGQGRCVGGAVVGSKALIEKDIFTFLRNAGPTMSPFNAWVFLKGLETLPLRMRAHSAAALELAQWLTAHPAVARVNYPGLETHPQHALARRQQSGFGGVLSFELEGGRAAAWSVIDAVRMISITGNLGDTKSTITHPATTTHGKLSAEQKAAAGITEGLIRVSVGLEDVTDIRRDLARGLDALAR